MWYKCTDIMTLLDVSESKAYQIIRNLGDELKNKGFMKPPAGRIQKTYFCERFNLSLDECERVLAQVA